MNSHINLNHPENIYDDLKEKISDLIAKIVKNEQVFYIRIYSINIMMLIFNSQNLQIFYLQKMKQEKTMLWFSPAYNMEWQYLH